jgi:hypothetical protein
VETEKEEAVPAVRPGRGMETGTRTGRVSVVFAVAVVAVALTPQSAPPAPQNEQAGTHAPPIGTNWAGQPLGVVHVLRIATQGIAHRLSI